mmetsp:Transcript_14962/g.23160  ORF Transcript_14962/g.23160 Transcript_14962/m.23160 type:complete len:126 (-) Transcript_14962:65-442(-)
MATSITPYVVMAPVEVPLDLSMITEPMDLYIPLIDVGLQRFFWEYFGIFVGYTFGYIPISLALVLVFEFIFLPILFWILIGINGPIAAILGFYFYSIYEVAAPLLAGGEESTEDGTDTTTTDTSS